MGNSHYFKSDDEKPTFPIKALALISGRVHRNETKRPVLIHGEMRFIQEVRAELIQQIDLNQSLFV